jgi:hypothetical protein
MKIRKHLTEYGISESGYDPGHRVEVKEKVILFRNNGGRKEDGSKPDPNANYRHDNLLEIPISDSKNRHPDSYSQPQADSEKKEKGQQKNIPTDLKTKEDYQNKEHHKRNKSVYPSHKGLGKWQYDFRKIHFAYQILPQIDSRGGVSGYLGEKIPGYHTCECKENIRRRCFYV